MTRGDLLVFIIAGAALGVLVASWLVEAGVFP